MLLHSIHTFAKLALKKTVPTQPLTSPHVTGLVHICTKTDCVVLCK